jgi:IPT/TIG domain-containing protein/repeat uncharacterized protein DUF346
VGAPVARPKVTGLSPRSAPDTGGGTANVTGGGFTGATAVKFGTVSSASINVVDDTALTATIPPHSAQVVDVKVAAGGSVCLAGPGDRFTFYSSLGGGLTAPPDVASWGGGRLDAFGRAPDGALWHRWREAGQWSAWDSLGGGLAPNAGVGAVAWAQNRLDIFVVGADNGLWHKWWSGAAWSSWEPLGGTLTSGPDVASWVAGRLDVFARGTPDGLFHRWWDGVHWAGWEGLGGSLASGPDPAAPGVGVLDVFFRAPDGSIWGRTYSGGWQTPRSMYLAANTAPGAVASTRGISDLVTSGAGSSVLYTSTPPG